MSPTPASKFIVALGGALFSAEGKLLLLRRISGEWALPGGMLEVGESPEIGLVRSFQESTGMEVSVDRPLGAWSAQNSAGESRVQIDFTVRHSSALLGVEIDSERYSGFAWCLASEVGSKLEMHAAAASVQRAFATLARTRKNL